MPSTVLNLRYSAIWPAALAIGLAAAALPHHALQVTTPVNQLPRSVAEAPGTAGPHGGSRPSAESHPGNAR